MDKLVDYACTVCFVEFQAGDHGVIACPKCQKPHTVSLQSVLVEFFGEDWRKCGPIKPNDYYTAWIFAHVDQQTKGYGQCEQVTAAMVQAFPELERRKGIIRTLCWGERTHWWCRTAGGAIVDPTAGQFPGHSTQPSRLVAKAIYEDMSDCTDEELADRVPSGVCANCGTPVFHGDSFCSTACQNATLRYLNSI